VAHRVNDTVVGVANGGDTDTAGEVDELGSVDVDQDRVVGAVDVDWLFGPGISVTIRRSAEMVREWGAAIVSVMCPV